MDIFPDEWSPVRLGDLIRIKHGWAFKSEFFSEDLTGLPIVVNIGNFKYTGGFRFSSTTLKEYRDSYPEEFRLKAGEILLVMTCQTSGGEILGIPGRIPDDGRIYLHNQRMGKVVVLTPDKIDQDFLYWLFLWNDFNKVLVATATGTKILHTAPDRIESFTFNKPPLPEQRTIAHILGTLDDKIELNRRMNETLEAIARTIFKSWFVDFDPVRAKAEGREPACMDAETAALFPDSFEETEQEIAPKGWKLKPLDEIANFLNGLAMQKFPPESEDFLPVIKIAELHRGNTIGSDRASSNIDPRYIIEDGDLLFSWSGSLEVCIWCGGKGALNQHLFKVSSTEYPMWFLYFWLKEHLLEFQLIAAGKATTMGHIQRYHLREAKAATPIAPLIERVNVIIEPLLNLIIKNNLESRNLSLIRDVLLPRLLLGEIRVRGTEKSLEDLPSKEKLATC